MSNYLKTLDTKQLLKAKIKLRPITENGIPHMEMVVNGSRKYFNHLGHTLAVYINLGLLENLEVFIEMSGKQYSAQKETAIIIEEFVVDGFDLIPHLGQAEYSNDRNYRGSNNHYLAFNGIWSFKINEPFYNWYHKVSGQGWLLTP